MTQQHVESGEDYQADDDGPTRRIVGKPFTKGQSGNPAGRPRFRGASGRKGDRLPGSDLPTRAMILEEAYRRITVRDGDAEIELPAHRAVFRAMTMAAVAGSRLAQRQWTQLVQLAEEAQKREQVALFATLERDGAETRYSGVRREYVPIGDFDDEILTGLQQGVSIVRALHSGDDD
ncbi:DUF5681 domain-containing protein [Sphingomonas sp.]|uniref:DUF5681 domain-containing protein n=1 Tax=Sphingomonas sp. TaxID=28214 RepID=UPI003D6DA51B